jgi:hypothetical protein
VRFTLPTTDTAEAFCPSSPLLPSAACSLARSSEVVDVDVAIRTLHKGIHIQGESVCHPCHSTCAIRVTLRVPSVGHAPCLIWQKKQPKSIALLSFGPRPARRRQKYSRSRVQNTSPSVEAVGRGASFHASGLQPPFGSSWRQRICMASGLATRDTNHTEIPTLSDRPPNRSETAIHSRCQYGSPNYDAFRPLRFEQRHQQFDIAVLQPRMPGNEPLHKLGPF